MRVQLPEAIANEIGLPQSAKSTDILSVVEILMLPVPGEDEHLEIHAPQCRKRWAGQMLVSRVIIAEGRWNRKILYASIAVAFMLKIVTVDGLMGLGEKLGHIFQ